MVIINLYKYARKQGKPSKPIKESILYNNKHSKSYKLTINPQLRQTIITLCKFSCSIKCYREKEGLS